MMENTSQINTSQEAKHSKIIIGDFTVKPTVAQAEFLKKAQAYQLKPRFECTHQGVFYIGLKTDKEGNISEKPPLFLSDPIQLIGLGQDDSGNYYRIIKWRDPASKKFKETAIPMAEIGTPQCWQRLQSYGLAIDSDKVKRNLLANYLLKEGLQTFCTIATKAGWRDNAYIFPSGEVLQSDDRKENRVMYNGDKSQAHAYQERGTLKEWNNLIGRYLVGNSRLCFAIGVPLAALLLTRLQTEAGGFHLFGDSRDGKSTLARLALSVLGNSTELLQSWGGTGHGFTNLANARNDGLLALDEIGQANPHHVSQTAYAVINGMSKVQGAKEGGNREQSRWKVMLLSTGEKPMDTFMKSSHHDWHAGQAARLPSFPSNAGKGLGIYDTLHGYPDGAVLSETLTEAAMQQHGTLGRAFIRLLQEQPDTIQEVKQLRDDFMQLLSGLSGQARTVALRFALVAAALELAAKHELIPLSNGAAFTAIKQCFDAWLERNGSGKHEDAMILEAAINFAQQNFHSGRFVSYPTQGEITPPNLAGYKKKGASEESDKYYILPKVFEEEIAKGFDKRKACEVLHKVRWLQRPNEKNRWVHKLSNEIGRCYLFVGALPPEEMTADD